VKGKELVTSGWWREASGDLDRVETGRLVSGRRGGNAQGKSEDGE